MKKSIIALVACALAGCGVDTATTAVSAAAVKKQEVEQGRQTMERARQGIGQAMEQAQQSAQRAGEADGK